MANFKVPVVQITVHPHDNADVLEIAEINGTAYRSIVPKGQYKTGDIAVYIPEQAIVPETIIEELGLAGKLAGSKKNRVKAIRLRGVFSQGLLYPLNVDADIGDDVAELLDIIKYVPPIPSHMKGEVCNVGREYTINFDIDNIKNFPDAFQSSDIIDVTEKIHGTFMMVGAYRHDSDFYHEEVFSDGKVFVASKGLGAKGLTFKNNEANQDNIYVRSLIAHELEKKSQAILEDLPISVEGILLLGEVFGKGVQDLSYDSNVGQPDSIGYRLFHIVMIEKETLQKYHMSPLSVRDIAKKHNLDMPTLLYRGPYSMEDVLSVTEGKETISQKEIHMREGVVVYAHDLCYHNYDDQVGVKILKSISPEYLLRKNGTEFN